MVSNWVAFVPACRSFSAWGLAVWCCQRLISAFALLSWVESTKGSLYLFQWSLPKDLLFPWAQRARCAVTQRGQWECQQTAREFHRIEEETPSLRANSTSSNYSLELHTKDWTKDGSQEKGKLKKRRREKKEEKKKKRKTKKEEKKKKRKKEMNRVQKNKKLKKNSWN